MAGTYKGILSFPALWTPKLAKGATEPKYGLQLLFPPGDPELTRIWNDYQIALKETYPSGVVPPKADFCLMNYKAKFEGKEYYDPRLADWWVFSCSAKADDRPAVVGMDGQPIIDPGSVCSGMIVYVNAGISGYNKGTGGIGGWLNGVLSTGEMGQLGRLDNKPSVDQMFAGITGGAPVGGPPAAAPGAAYTASPAPTPAYAAAPAPTPGYSAPPAAPAMPSAPVPPAPPAAPVPAAAPAKVMTAKAGGATYESFIANNWTDVMLVEHGYMTIGGITPSFVG